MGYMPLIAQRIKNNSIVSRYGTMIFLDISGFTSLSERAAEYGVDGTDIVSEILNDFFGKIKNIALGGDIIKFAGDAMWIWFDGKDLSCLEELKRFVKKPYLQSTPFGNIKLTLKILGGEGKVDFTVIKGKYQKDIVFGGNIIDWILEKEKTLKGGEILLKNGTLKSNKIIKATKHKEIDFIPHVIRDKLKAENRRTVILFSKYRGTLKELIEIYPLIEDKIYKNGGTLTKVMPYKGGYAFLSVFGVPVSSRYDIQKACKTAMDIKDKKITSGIAEGVCYAGIVKAKSRKEYTLIGDSVNFAARLMDIDNKSAIFIPASVYLFNQYEGKNKGKITIKGKKDKVEIYELQNKEKSKDDLVIERDDELNKINKTKGNVFLYGESGVGKTALLNRVKQFYKNIIEGKGDFRKYAFSLVESLTNYIMKERKDINNVPTITENMLRILQDIAKGKNIKYEVKKDIYFAILKGYLSYIKPTIIIDDIHYADMESIEILKKIISNTDIKIIMAAEEKIEVFDNTMYMEIKGIKNIKSFIKNIFRRDIDEYALKILQKFTKGNPLFIKEYLYYFLDKGIFMIKDEKIFNVEENIDVLPGNIHALLQGKMDILPQDTVEGLRKFSIYGYKIEKDLIEKIGFDKKLFLPAIEQDILEETEREFIFKNSIIKDMLYKNILRRDRIKLHKKIGQVIENLYGKEKAFDVAYNFYLGNMGRKAVDYAFFALSEDYADFSLSNVDKLIKIIEDKGTQKDKNKLIIKKCETLRMQGKLKDALICVQNTIKNYTGQTKTKAQLLEIKIMENMGYIDEAIEKSNEYMKTKRGKTKYNFMYVKGLSLIHKGEYKKAVNYITGIIKKVSSKGMLANLYSILGLAYYYRGIYTEAEKHTKMGIKLSLEINSFYSFAPAYNTLGLIKWKQGKIDEAEKYFIEARKHYEQFSIRDGAGTAANLGVIYFNKREFKKAITQWNEVYFLFDAMGNIRGAGVLLMNIGTAYYLLEEDELALMMLEEAKKLIEESGDIGIYATIIHNIAEIKCMHGNEKEAEKLWEKAYEIRIKKGQEDRTENILFALSEVYVYTKHIDKFERIRNKIDKEYAVLFDVKVAIFNKDYKKAQKLLKKIQNTKQEYIKEASKIILKFIKTGQIRKKKYKDRWLTKLTEWLKEL